ncbi:hypothetical protein Vretimale_18468 [Volvox reticuliferus]|nr:hypothetical protein Vretimale_18468 [Volvox reticuliferus]
MRASLHVLGGKIVATLLDRVRHPYQLNAAIPGTQLVSISSRGRLHPLTALLGSMDDGNVDTAEPMAQDDPETGPEESRAEMNTDAEVDREGVGEDDEAGDVEATGGGEEGPDEDDEEVKPGEDSGANDMKLAWDMLEVARVLYCKNNPEEHHERLAEVHKALGDIKGEEGPDEDGDSEGGEEDDEEVKPGEDSGANDMKLAWDMLEVARVLYCKNNPEEHHERLAEVHKALGDIKSEEERFEEAVECYKQSLYHLESMQPRNNRRLAEVQYLLSLVLTYLEQPEEALQVTQTALASLEAAVAEIEEKLAALPTDGSGGEAAEEEGCRLQAISDDLRGVIGELHWNITGLQEAIANKNSIKESVKCGRMGGWWWAGQEHRATITIPVSVGRGMAWCVQTPHRVYEWIVLRSRIGSEIG